MLLRLLALEQAATGAANQVKPEAWVLLGLGAALLIYMLVLRPMMRRRKDPLERPPAFASLSQQRAVERQMQNLLVELAEMARQISAQLDTRAAKLEQLIQDADRRLEALGQAVRAAGNGAASDEAEPAHSASSHAPNSQSSPPEQPDPRHAQVYALADAGRDAHQIAAALGRPEGEVELILALRGRGGG
jgi:uncharacterized membrane-anchored protein YhcB (DUF1043 family)